MDHETAIELADWLAHMQEVSKTLAHMPAGREHLAKLELWEKTVRAVAAMSDDCPNCGYERIKIGEK